MKTNAIAPSGLESITAATPVPRSSHLAIPGWFGQLWQSITAFLTDAIARQNELQVHRTYDRNGLIWWYVYDPATGRTAWLNSEDEVRIWIEENY